MIKEEWVNEQWDAYNAAGCPQRRIDFLADAAYKKGVSEGVEKGRKEVVEWIEENVQSVETSHESHMSSGEFFLGIDPDEWKAKLKEWQSLKESK